jgi:signal transduction histidine kinase
MEKSKIHHWNWAALAILWGISPQGRLRTGPRPMLTQGKISNQKAGRMGQVWRRFFSLDFDHAFWGSLVKLLVLWNPIWTLLMSLWWGEWRFTSILFRWGWSFIEAELVTLFAFAMVRVYLFLEQGVAARSTQVQPRHGMGWYLLSLAFMVPPGIYLALHLMVATINRLFEGDPIPAEFHWQYYGTGIFWSWGLLLFFFLFQSWQDLKNTARFNQLRAEELEKERLQALLANLKDQMNPHFLFNTLNTVASLIPVDPSKAEQVLVKLSTLYQGLLAATRRTLHPLEKELEFCRDYLDIEKARFGSRLEVQWEIQKGLDLGRVQVPVLILQPLVENAIKHGLSSRAAGGRLWIKAETKEGRLELRVEDDGIGFGNSSYRGSGTALENCRKRLELGYGAQGSLQTQNRQGGGAVVLLTLPVPDDLSRAQETK